MPFTKKLSFLVIWLAFVLGCAEKSDLQEVLDVQGPSPSSSGSLDEQPLEFLEEDGPVNHRAESFASEWCNNPSIPHESALTVYVLKQLIRHSDDCLEVGLALSERRSLIIDMSGMGFSLQDLRPLALFTNLEFLKITGNDWGDLSILPALSSLSGLKQLELPNNNLVSVLGISHHLPQLIALDLSNNRLGNGNLQGLQKFEKLEWLDLSGNALRQLPTIPGTVTHLLAQDNHLRTTPAFRGLWQTQLFPSNQPKRNSTILSLDIRNQSSTPWVPWIRVTPKQLANELKAFLPQSEIIY